jgi:hypothetical protein
MVNQFAVRSEISGNICALALAFDLAFALRLRLDDHVFGAKGKFQMTKTELIHMSYGFRKMIEAIPKMRVREHMPAINQISKLLERLRSEISEAPASRT